MRKSRGRREGEKEESSGKVKLEEMGEMASGGVGAKVVAREGGRGKKKESREEEAEECLWRITVRGRGRVQFLRENRRIC